MASCEKNETEQFVQEAQSEVVEVELMGKKGNYGFDVRKVSRFGQNYIQFKYKANKHAYEQADDFEWEVVRTNIDTGLTQTHTSSNDFIEIPVDFVTANIQLDLSFGAIVSGGGMLNTTLSDDLCLELTGFFLHNCSGEFIVSLGDNGGAAAAFISGGG